MNLRLDEAQSIEDKGSNASVVMLMGNDPFTLASVEQIVASCLEIGETWVIDTTSTSVAATETYFVPFLKLTKYKSPPMGVQEYFEALGATFVEMNANGGQEVESKYANSTEITQAIESALITCFRHHNPLGKIPKANKYVNAFRNEALLIERALSEFFRENEKINEIYIPNGRFPSQKIISLVAEDFGIETKFYERGEPPRGIYLQPYPPQDRIRSQEAAVSITQNLSDSKIARVASEWISTRRNPNNTNNEFSALWSPTKKFDEMQNIKNSVYKKRAGFFTSSQDEFLHLGPEWQRHSWTSQVEAFDITMSRLESAGYELIMRVHPNLATKAHSYFKTEVKELTWLVNRHPELRIIWHDESINTYELLDEIDVCFVWDSTVGLEASAMGIPTWTFATTRYGLVADIKEVLSEFELPQLNFEWDVNPHGASRFINYLLMRDVQMQTSPSQFVSWDLDKEPLIIQLSKVLTSGGAISPMEGIRATIDPYRNRNMQANIKFARQRIKSLFGKI